MNSVNIAICDDDYYFCAILEKYVLEYKEKSGIGVEIKVFQKGESLLKYIEDEHKFDLIFLDIELDTKTGIEIGNTIRKDMDDHISKIIFVTAKDGYELQLFGIQPLDFIKKPIDKVKLFSVIDLGLKLLHIEKGIFTYKKAHDFINVRIDEIVYFEKDGRKIKIVTTTGVDYFNGTLEQIKMQNPEIFAVPYNSFVVNWEKVNRLVKDHLIMQNGDKIPVSQRNAKAMRQKLMNFEKEVGNGIL